MPGKYTLAWSGGAIAIATDRCTEFRDIFRWNDIVIWEESPFSRRQALHKGRLGFTVWILFHCLGIVLTLENQLYYKASDIAPACKIRQSHPWAVLADCEEKYSSELCLLYLPYVSCNALSPESERAVTLSRCSEREFASEQLLCVFLWSHLVDRGLISSNVLRRRLWIYPEKCCARFNLNFAVEGMKGSIWTNSILLNRNSSRYIRTSVVSNSMSIDAVKRLYGSS